MNTKEEKQLKKQIWDRRHKEYPHLIEITIVYNLLENLTKHDNDFKASAGKKIISVKQGKLPSQLLEEDEEPSPKPCPCKCHTTIHHALFHDGDICPKCGNKKGRAS